jgi:2-amino-4-hydroxy-6-hydroxymethyldihydropteridine diphosphokinase
MTQLDLQPTMVLIGLGGNLPSVVGPPARTIAAALDRLAAQGVGVLARSALYRTAPVPASAQPWFVNAVAQVDDALAPDALLDLLLTVEVEFGRQRGAPNAARTLDLDLLAYGATCRDDARLTLPHPRLHERAFVLHPLCDVAPEWRHPRLGRTARELLHALPPGPPVERISV